ncbi:MAG TPA: hypothetical protein VJS47_03805 [Rhizomicrobium sp.]|nr:hypothetical protein [Rhizomicrobium sp.]
MSLRDFNAPVCDDPIALHHQPVGNATGLENFHTIHPEDIEPNSTPKIVGALAVALMIGAAGVALYTSISSRPPEPVTMAANLPAPAAPPAPLPAAVTPDTNTPASMPAAAPAPTLAPVQASVPRQPSQTASVPRSATPSVGKDAASVRLAADAAQSTVQPPAPVIAEPIAKPMAPTPSPSDVATNTIQSGVAVPPNATMAADIPAQGQASSAPQPLQPSTPPASDAAQDPQTGAAPAQ